MHTYNPAHELTSIEQHYKRGAALLALPRHFVYTPQPEFSRWSAAGHLVHLARTNLAILDAIERLTNNDGVEGAPTRLGAFLLLWGRIPRRRAQAAKSIQPPENLERSEAYETWNTSQVRLTELTGKCQLIRQAQPRFEHYIFGALTAAEWVRFMAIHTNHHLRLAEDILLLRSGGH